MFSIGKGYDPDYLTQSVGKGAENYYLSAVREHGEPPGYWSGRGAEALGLTPGSEVDATVMEKLYGEFYDVRDPAVFDDELSDSEKPRLGRKPAKYMTAQDIYEKKLSVEPEATEERKKQLLIQAKKEERKSLQFFDLTFSPSKSVTLLHAGLLAMEKQAREAGDLERARAAGEAARVVEATVKEAAATGIDVANSEAGWARVGYHGKKVGGDSTGRWHAAGGWVVSSFFQHTSRSGDPQLHVHNAVLNRQLCEDGEWRSLDGQAIYRARAAFSAIAERTLMERLTAQLGVRWIQRTDGQGFEIEGVTPEQVAEFSSRRVEVTERLAELVEAYERRHGYEPNARTMYRLAQQATKDTKTAKPKTAEAPTADQELEQWERQTTEAEIDSLTAIPGQALFQVSDTERREAAEAVENLDFDRIVEMALADAQKEKATFTRWEMTRHLTRYLPPCLGGLESHQVRGLLEGMTEEALSPSEGPSRVLRLNIPDVVDIPGTLMRDHEWSVFRSPSAERWTTPDQLTAEQAFLNSAAQVDGPVVDADVAAARVGLGPAAERTDGSDTALSGADQHGSGPEQATVGTSLSSAKEPAGAERPESGVDTAVSGTDQRASGAESEETEPVLASDQAAAVYGILTSGRRTDVLEGYAGTGKSFTVSRLADLWRETTGAKVLALTTAQNAAQVLKDEGMDEAVNIARWLHNGSRLQRGQLVVVDESSMVTTDHLTQIQRAADRAGAKILLTGDSEQLAAPGAGGLMRQLVAERGSFQLTSLFRFKNDWEKDASARLRAGDTEVLDLYEQHGRLRSGTRQDMEQAAVEAYVADTVAGRQSLLLTGTNATAHELAGRVREALVNMGRVSDTRTAQVRGDNPAGVGDLITARENSRSIPITVDGEDRTLSNRDRLQVTSVGEDGQIRARLLDKRDRPGAPVMLPASYVREEVELAYAGTATSSQGRTVKTAHPVVEPGMSRQMLYVMMSRGAEGNWAWVVTDEESADLRPENTADAAVSGPDSSTSTSDTGRGEASLEAPTHPSPQEAIPGLETSAPAAVSGPEPGMTEPTTDGSTPETSATTTERDAAGVLAEILETDQADQTAIETMRIEADRVTHMAHLGSMWTSLVKDDVADQTTKALKEALPADINSKLNKDPARGSVLTAVRQAVLGGHDLREVVSNAAEETWEGVRSVGQALQARIEKVIGTGDVEATSWVEMTPRLANSEMGAFVTEVAEQMDTRVWDLGERAAADPPSYLVERLGEPPEEIMAHSEWVQRAGRVQSYREQFGNERETNNVLGAAPDRHSPEQRASWFAAARSLGQNAAEQAVSAAKDGALWVQRAAYERAARWAPPHVGDRLAQSSIERDDRAREAVRLRAEAAAEQDEKARRALEQRAQAAEDLSRSAGALRGQLQQVQDQREAWVSATEEMRQQAMLADSELHRRHDDLDLPSLHQSDEESATDHRQDERVAEPDEPRDWNIQGQAELFGLGEAGPVRRQGQTERPEAEAEASEPVETGPVQEELNLGLLPEEPVQEGDSHLRRALEQARAAKSFLRGLANREAEAGRDQGQEPTVEERSRERYRDDLALREETELQQRREKLEQQAAEREQAERRAPTAAPPAPHRRGPEREGPSLGL